MVGVRLGKVNTCLRKIERLRKVCTRLRKIGKETEYDWYEA